MSRTRVLTSTAVASTAFAAMLMGSTLPLFAQEIAEKELAKPTATLKDGLKSARAIRPLADGRVLVYDDEAKQIVVADLASGKVEKRMSQGTDDGEFMAPGPLWRWPGDSVAIYDNGKARLMIFGPDGAPARMTRLGPQRPSAGSGVAAVPPGAPPPGGGPPEGAPTRGGGMPGGGFPGGGRGGGMPSPRYLIGGDMVVGVANLQAAPTALAPTAPPARVPFAVMRLSLRAPRPDTVVTLMPPQRPRNPTNPQQNGGTLSIFVSTAPVQSVDAWAVLSDGTVAVVRAASYRVEWFPLVGDHAFTDPIAYTPIPITKDDKKRVVDAYKRIGEQQLQNHPMRTAILAVTYEEPQTWPATHPPFRGDAEALVDPQDRIWLATRCLKDEQANCYDVIGRNGARADRFKLPPKTRVVGFGPGVVYTAFEQKTDKDVLQRHPLS